MLGMAYPHMQENFSSKNKTSQFHYKAPNIIAHRTGCIVNLNLCIRPESLYRVVHVAHSHYLPF